MLKADRDGGVWLVRSESMKMINLYEIPANDLQKLVDVLQNDLKEYEQLDDDFGAGTERTIKRFIEEISQHLE